jgi:DeoR/GlpR family transcriptional regulator of sugar metabolism
MSAFDRRSEIIRYLQENQRASTRRLSELFEVSEVTIRHDLNKLEEKGWISRVHGGAEIVQRVQRLLPEQSFEVRQSLHIAEKNRIAQAAAALVQPGDTIIMDISTSVFQMVLHLQKLTSLRVVTNCLRTADALTSCSNGIEVVLLGGTIRCETASVVGPFAEDMLANLHADKGFLGTAGLTPERGLTDVDSREIQVKRAMVKAVDQVNILADSSKFGEQAFLTFAKLEEIDHLFTDDKFPAEYIDVCQAAGLELTIV